MNIGHPHRSNVSVVLTLNEGKDIVSTSMKVLAEHNSSDKF